MRKIASELMSVLELLGNWETLKHSCISPHTSLVLISLLSLSGQYTATELFSSTITFWKNCHWVSFKCVCSHMSESKCMLVGVGAKGGDWVSSSEILTWTYISTKLDRQPSQLAARTPCLCPQGALKCPPDIYLVFAIAHQGLFLPRCLPNPSLEVSVIFRMTLL